MMNYITYQKLIEECIKELNKDFDDEFTRGELNSLITVTKVVPEDVCKKMDRIIAYETKKHSHITTNDIVREIKVGNSNMMLHKGDVTKLKVGAIVNAANSAMLGCFSPGHKCVDNVIHCAAGPRLRNECGEIMKGVTHAQLGDGEAIITGAYCLPCKHVIHTAGPVVSGDAPTSKNQKDLQDCYVNCLELCKTNNLRDVAFTNISTGVFGYPVDGACEVAIGTVKSWLEANQDYQIDVIFCTFTSDNYGEYLQYF